MQINKLNNSDLRSAHCNSILRSLPLWFGIESAIVDYVKDVRTMDTWVAAQEDEVVGIISINKHFSESAEIHVVGILQNFHRMGIGHQLVETAQNSLKNEGFKFLTVKTLSESRANEEYNRTRQFYLKLGFTPLEEFKTLWGEHNPCLFLVKPL